MGYAYDALNRVTAKDLPGSEPDVAYSYDLLGRPTGVATAAQTLGFTYDALGRMLTQSGPLGTDTSQYNAAGRRTRLSWADGFYVTFDHRVTGELTAIRENGAASGTGVLATFGYDDLGRRTFVTRLMTTTDLTDREIARIMGWSEVEVERIRRIYVDDMARTVALGRRIARGL